MSHEAHERAAAQEQQDLNAQYVAEMLDHPGWPLVQAFLVSITAKANDELQKSLRATTIDGVAIASLNVAATKDTIRAVVYGIYSRAGAEVPAGLKEALR